MNVNLMIGTDPVTDKIFISDTLNRIEFEREDAEQMIVHVAAELGLDLRELVQ